jgi:peroxiredoxin
MQPLRPFLSTFVSLTTATLFATLALASPAHSALAPSAAEAKPLAVGAKAPAPTLTAADGTAVDLGAAFAGKTTVLIFYRGSWCPYCNRHLAALAELEPKLLALGCQIIAVSPDSAEGLKKMAGKNHLAYRLLSDREMLASSAYGLAFRLSPETEKAYRGFGVELTPVPGGEGFWLPVPAVFIVGRDGFIKFAHSDPDYKARLSPTDLLTAAEAAVK